MSRISVVTGLKNVTSRMRSWRKKLEYRNLALRFETIGTDRLRLVLSGGGEASEILERSCLDPLLIESVAEPADFDSSCSTRDIRRRHRALPVSPGNTGGRLFDTLFNGQVRELFCTNLAAIDQPGQGIRLILALDITQPEQRRLQYLPWELLWYSAWRSFLALDRRISLVRSLAVPRPVVPMPAGETLECLVATAAPNDAEKLDLAGEIEHIAKALKDQERIHAHFLDSADVSSIRERLLLQPSPILHFAGHGYAGRQQGLILEGEQKASRCVDASRWAEQLADLHLRLVVLNACSTAAPSHAADEPFHGVAQALIRAGLPAVVAMREPILDAAGLVFAQKFYGRLARLDTVDAALSEARLALRDQLPDSSSWALPTLFLGGDHGSLFVENGAQAAQQLPQRSRTDIRLELAEAGDENEVSGFEGPLPSAAADLGIHLNIGQVKNRNKIVGISTRSRS